VNIPQDKIQDFQKKILDWYKLYRRDLPWRKTRDPYKILVSEVMLQQTQVSRVLPKYEAWCKKFPTMQSLACAKTSEVLHVWSGLGYNRRALNLQKCVQAILQLNAKRLRSTAKSEEAMGDEAVVWPRTEKELLALPGIGKYTARALLCFAFDEQVAVVDTNVKKVIMTNIMKKELRTKDEMDHNSYFLFHDAVLESSRTLSEKELWEIAEALVPPGRAYDWNQALMDYASAVLKHERIPIPKQSKFIGSRRYYRGKILKLLLKKNEIMISDLGPLVRDDYTDKNKTWLEALLKELAQEGFIDYDIKTVRLRQ